jgi:hypothetical protein
MIEINKTIAADTRSCDWSKVTKDELLTASMEHINHVGAGMHFFIQKLNYVILTHDITKLTHFNWFHDDFLTGFKQVGWYQFHKEKERHHISSPDGVRDDVDVIDLIEHLVDCVMAGMARTGEVYPINLSNELLQNIVKNTVAKLKNEIVVK